MSRFAFELAGAEHDLSLRRLFAETEMDGEIKISFRREPSYFHASRVQGPFYQVVAARDTLTSEVVGVGTRAVRPGFLNGAVAPVGYLADLRLAPPYRGGPLVARAYRHLNELDRDGRTEIYFTVIAEGNRHALQTLAAGRAGIPPYRDFGRVLSPAVNLRRRKPAGPAGVEIRRGTVDLLPEIVDCINRNHRRRQFAPCYAVADFRSADADEAPATRGFRVEDFYVALRGGKIRGVLGKWDQSSFKQAVVTGYAKRLLALRPALNFAARLTGGPVYPPPGTELRFFHASFIAVDDDDLVVFAALLRRLYNDHVGAGYDYFVLGLHERDPLTAALRDYCSTPFAARLFVVCFDQRAVRALDRRVPYVEAAAF
ncbi:MAG TPA: hypothetical protein VNN77_14115 [candidate division Zixibacteria bacterium]|nr:hypothetical protein [candidate division Zixibacteria bacterium]